MLQKLARHDRDVISARQMLGGVRRIVEAGAVDKMRVLHPKLGRARVHSLDKRRLTPGDMLGKRRRAVVGELTTTLLSISSMLICSPTSR